MKKIYTNLTKNQAHLEFSRFIIVGLFNAVINYSIFALFLLAVKLNYIISGAIGFMACAFSGFILNRKWTFKSTVDYKSGMTKYIIIQIFCLGLHNLTQFIVTDIFLVPEIFSQFAGIFVTTFINFFLIRKLIFRTKL
jgi:putative flippase GtrA